MTRKWWWIALILLLAAASVMLWCINVPPDQPTVAVQDSKKAVALLEALEENGEVLAHLKCYEAMEQLLKLAATDGVMRIDPQTRWKVRQALEAAKRDYKNAQLPYLAEREGLLRKTSALLDALPPDASEALELEKGCLAKMGKAKERNRVLSANFSTEFTTFVMERELLLKQGQLKPTDKLESSCNAIAQIMLEQLEIDLRGQVTVLLLHKTRPAVHTNTPVPTADLLDSTKWRLR